MRQTTVVGELEITVRVRSSRVTEGGITPKLEPVMVTWFGVTAYSPTALRMAGDLGLFWASAREALRDTNRPKVDKRFILRFSSDPRN
jgi:hypothetical protein